MNSQSLATKRQCFFMFFSKISFSFVFFAVFLSHFVRTLTSTSYYAVFVRFLEGIRRERLSLQPSGRGLMAVWELAHKQAEGLSRKVAG